MKKLFTFRAGFAALALATLVASPALSQVPASNPPYNTDIGAVLTSQQRTAATYNSASQTNLDKTGVVCTLNQTVSSGSPSTTFAIQEYDAASATWYTVLTSSAITGYPGSASATPAQLAVKPGIQTTSDPTNGYSLSWVLTRVWRIQAIVGSGTGAAGPASTFTVGCNYSK